MNNPKTEEIVEALLCRAYQDDCTEDCICYSNKDFDCVSNFTVLTAAVDFIEQLQQELIDERYRHDRLQDFCVAQGDELSKIKAQQRWIPVTERLPEDDDDVLIMSSGSISMGYFNIFRGYWVDYEGDDDNITHWMPLPEPPKE